MKILFQDGTSSDDPGRLCRGASPENGAEPGDLGESFAKYAAVMFTDAYPDTEFSFYRNGMNEGEAPDIICLLPDFLAPVSDGEYEDLLVGELTRLRTYQDARILVLEPFLAKEDPALRDRVDDRVNATRRAATGNADILIPLDGLFAAERIAHPDIDYADENGMTPEGYCFLGECCFRATSPLIDLYIEKGEST